MRKGKLVIKRIEEKIKRQVTFSKRRKSLMKKAHELSILCDAHIGLIIFSQSNKFYNFCSHSTSMENLIMRYQKEKEGHTTADHSFHQDHGSNCAEMKESMMREINNLEMNLLLYQGGHALNLLTYDDLIRFELQLEFSLQNARARKAELMQQQQMDKVKGKGKGKEILNMDEETQHFYNPGQGSSWEHLTWQSERHMMMTCPKQEDSDVQVKKVFPFDGEEQPTGVLQFLHNLLPLPSLPATTSGTSQ